jgi:hypothetical protein
VFSYEWFFPFFLWLIAVAFCETLHSVQNLGSALLLPVVSKTYEELDHQEA